MAFIQPGTYIIKNKMTGTVIDLKDQSSANETPVHGWEELPNTPTQRWKLEISKVGGLFGRMWTDFTGRTFSVTNEGTGTALDLFGSDKSNGARVQGYQKHGRQNQLWIFDGDEQNGYVIINGASRTALDLAGGNGANGNGILGWQKNGGDNQRWFLIKV